MVYPLTVASCKLRFSSPCNLVAGCWSPLMDSFTRSWHSSSEFGTSCRRTCARQLGVSIPWSPAPNQGSDCEWPRSEGQVLRHLHALQVSGNSTHTTACEVYTCFEEFCWVVGLIGQGLPPSVACVCVCICILDGTWCHHLQKCEPGRTGTGCSCNVQILQLL